MTTETMFGKAMKRREDPRMITGRGQYVDDLHFPNMQSVVFVRSPYAHAKITKIDTSAAEKHPGVMKIYTGKDFGQVPVPCGVNLPNSNQISPMYPVIPSEGKIPAAQPTNVDALIASGEDVMDNVVQISHSLNNILDRMERGEVIRSVVVL